MRMRRLTTTTLALLALCGTRAEAGFLDFLFGGGTITPKPIATYASGVFDEGAAEIVAYDAGTKQFFVTNADENTVDVLEYDGGTLDVEATIDLSPYGDGVNSVAVHDGLVAVAVEADPSTDPGSVVFFDAETLAFVGEVTAGALPDMVTFTPNGRHALVANEGEPNDEYTVDPEGSVTIVDVREFLRLVKTGGDPQESAKTADFTTFNAGVDPRIRIFGPGASVAQDLEPEYVAVSDDSRTAYVVCQENNALATIDIRKAEVTAVESLGYKDHSLPGNGIDASNRDDGINIQNWPVLGMYQPDAIATTRLFGLTVVHTVNEGDARDYDGFSEEERVADLVLDPSAYPDAATLQLDENLGRLNSTTATGDTDGDGDVDQIYAYGARSYSSYLMIGGWPIQIFDSGDALEQITAEALPDDFNSTNDENDSFDNRSDDKGPEPEALTTGRIGGRTYAFIGLERVGGVVTYDITNPFQPKFSSYVNNRDFAGDAEAGTARDLGPESIVFIPASKSPVEGTNVIAVANEVSGSVTLYELERAGGSGWLSLLPGF